MIEDLKINIKNQVEILKELSFYIRQFEMSGVIEKRQMIKTIDSLKRAMSILNDSLPEIVRSVTLFKKIDDKNQPNQLEKVHITKKDGGKVLVVLKKTDKERFLTELNLSSELIKKIKKKESEIEDYADFKESRGYLKLANKIFLNTSQKLSKTKFFSGLYGSIRKANIDTLLETYISMILFTTSLSFILGLFMVIFLIYFEIGFIYPWIEPYYGEVYSRIGTIFWIPLALPILTFFTLYLFPSTERDYIGKSIDQELPFAVVHMSSIAGSGISPAEIFRIISKNKDYPTLRREVRKILNQMNVYGYDLVNALSNVARVTPSSKFSELLTGLATTINSGGSLSEFFQKRSETLLSLYRLEREKFNRLAETFMDIYISVVIATPMILMLLLIMIYMTQPEISFSIGTMTIGIVAIVAIVNVLFIGFLKIKQPTY